MPPSEDNSRIEELKETLYSRNAPDVRTRRKLRFSAKNSELKTAWDKEEEPATDPVLNRQYEKHSMPFLTKVLIGSAIFFIFAVGLGAYLFFNGANLISANNIDIVISGPVSVAGGEVVPFDIQIKNDNNVDLQMADMLVEFPVGTTDPDNPSEELKSKRELVGDIRAGGFANKGVKAIIFGEENLQKQIDVTVTYKVKGSNSLFTKKKSYEILISSSPITVTISSMSKITSGQEFDIKAKVKSNSQEVLKNVILKSEYPFGYKFISSDVKPLSDNATWKIGDIPPGSEKTVSIHGKLEGQDTDLRVFRFSVGAQSSANPSVIGTRFADAEYEISIEKPFISVALNTDGEKTESGDTIGQFGNYNRIQINWFNNLPEAVSNVQIVAKLSGSGYDKQMVQADMGYFRSAENDIVWNQQTNPELASIPAGGSGSVSFGVSPKDSGSGTNPVTNPVIDINVAVSGNRTQESGVPQTVNSASQAKIKVNSNVYLTGRVVRSTGPFGNTGPIPPKSEQPTTYTVVWTVDNTVNQVKNAVVTATLPAYVKWLGNFKPSSEIIEYNQNSGTVSWQIGSIGTNTSGTSKRREVSFQISYTPSVNQVGQAPILVNQADLSALDSFTGAGLQSQQDYLTTRFSTDPAYKNGDETVVQ